MFYLHGCRSCSYIVGLDRTLRRVWQGLEWRFAGQLVLVERIFVEQWLLVDGLRMLLVDELRMLLVGGPRKLLVDEQRQQEPIILHSQQQSI